MAITLIAVVGLVILWTAAAYVLARIAGEFVRAGRGGEG